MGRMREFKFRAWDTYMECFTLHDSFYEVQKWNRNEGELEFFKIQQWTGLKDKNGIDIFEGDILKSGKRYWEVVFSHASFMMSWGNGASQMFINEMVEVIGNIYENPELLRG